MEIVVDTNVFLDALFKTDRHAALVLYNEHKGRCSFVMSDGMREELLRQVSFHTLKLCKLISEANRVHRMVSRFMHRTRLLNPVTLVAISPHYPDNEFIACAIDAGVSFVVTYNTSHFSSTGHEPILNCRGEPIRVVSPWQFNAEMAGMIAPKGI